MDGKDAVRILKDLLGCLSGIEPEKMTSLEFALLWACAENPPVNGGDILKRIPNRDIFSGE